VGLHIGIRSNIGRSVARSRQGFLGWDRMEWEEQASPTGHDEKETNEEANYLPLVMIVTLRKLHDMIPTSVVLVWFLGLFSWVLLGVGIYLRHQMIPARLELSF